MPLSNIKRLVAIVFAIALSLSNPVLADIDAHPTYEQVEPSWDGTGRLYMGREIAPVMGYQGARWLERSSRNREEAADKLVRLLPLQADSQVADIGAGTGYMSFRIASRLPQGQIWAVDVQPEMIDLLNQRIEAEEATNIHATLGSEQQINLPEASLDLALMVDVYHELSYPFEMLEAIAHSLKADGKLVIAEYKAENPRVMIKPLHKMTQTQVRLELEEAGFKLTQNLKGLPQQHLLVFEKA